MNENAIATCNRDSTAVMCLADDFDRIGAKKDRKFSKTHCFKTLDLSDDERET